MGSLRAMVENRVGPYLLTDRLGSGGMAEVWVGENVESGAQAKYAIKRILPQLAKDSRFVAMFCDEARICAALHHPNIVRVLDFGEDRGELFMAMQYVEGTSCARLLRSVAAKGRRFPIEVALFVAREVLEALAYAHDAHDEKGRSLGIVHRDVSPGNILISSNGEVKLTDFGIVRSEFIARRTYPGELKGKIGYMSPEQVVGGDVDPRSDLFALGIVFAEMLLTRPLFPGRSEMETLTRIYEADLRTLDQHSDDIPHQLVDILHWILQRRPSDRPSCARQLAQKLDNFAVCESLEPTAAKLVSWLSELGFAGSKSGVRAATPNPEGMRDIRAMSPVNASAEKLRRRSSLPPRIASQGGVQPSGIEYEIRLSNGEMLSPMGPYELLESFATRRVPFNSMIIKNKGRPRTVRQLACLGAIVSIEDWIENALQSRMAYRHLLDRSRFSTFLFGLVKRDETALVVARDGSRQTVVAWERGSPVYAASSDRETLLGVHLVHGGVITEQQLVRAVETLSESEGGRLGDVLIEQRALLPADLLRVLVEQLTNRVLSLGSWESGEIWYVPGISAPTVGVRSNESSLNLLTLMIRTAFSGRELARILAVLGDGPIAASPVPRFKVQELGLSQQETDALKAVAGTRSLSRLMTEAAASATLRPDDILRATFIGLSAGLLVSPGWPWH